MRNGYFLGLKARFKIAQGESPGSTVTPKNAPGLNRRSHGMRSPIEPTKT